VRKQKQQKQTNPQRWPWRLLAAVLFPIVLLTGCAEEVPETTTPTAVLEQERNELYGRTTEVHRILLKGKELAEIGFNETGSLDLNSDYFNVRDGAITFSETWPGSWGVSRFFLVTLWPANDRLVMSSKDTNAVCWYVDFNRTATGFSVRYGASADTSCRALDVDTSSALWQEDTFPSGPSAE